MLDVRVGILVQVRMASRRFPRNPMLSLGPRSVIGHVLRRCRGSQKACDVAVVTSTDATDDVLADFCGFNGVRCFRGPMAQILHRHAMALEHLDWDGFARVLGNSPLIDPRLIDEAIDAYTHREADLVTNIAPGNFPCGQEIEVINSRLVRERAWRSSPTTEFERATDTDDARPLPLEVHTIQAPSDWTHTSTAIEVPEDLDTLRALYDRVGGPLLEMDWLSIAQVQAAMAEETVSEITPQHSDEVRRVA